MSDELSPAQLDELANDLQTRREQLTETLSSYNESAKVVDLDQPIGRLSRMDAIQQQKMAQSSKATAERSIRLIDTATRLLAGGSYGYCKGCDEPIGFRRLKARPETPLCLSCQREKE